MSTKSIYNAAALIVLAASFAVSGPHLALAAGDTWATKANMPAALVQAASASLFGKVYVFGGLSSTVYATVYEYDPATDTWATKTSMPVGVGRSATAVVNNKIYVLGGNNGSGTVATSQEYNPATDTWATKASIPSGEEFASAAAVNGKIYFVGGLSNSSGSTVATNANQEYDPAANTWAIKAPMPTTRSMLGVAAVGNKIYAIGGSTLWTFGSPLSVNEEYDPATNTWTTKASMPTARWGVMVSEVGNKIYAIGGISSVGSLGLTEEYDPATNTWVTRAPIPTTNRLWAGVATASNNKIYIIGGQQFVFGLGSQINSEYTPPVTVTPPTATIVIPTTDVSTAQNTPVAFSGTGTATGGSGSCFNLVISSNVNNYDILSAANAAGWTSGPVCLTINPGVIVSSVSTSLPALTTGAFPLGTSVAITNKGTIVGKGGDGGKGGTGFSIFPGMDGLPGSQGGDALSLGTSISLDNTGTILGGGGGGGGGGGAAWGTYGAGGGGGAFNGVGGLTGYVSPFSTLPQVTNGQDGSTVGGAGGIGYVGLTGCYTGDGGRGGDYGQGGSTGKQGYCGVWGVGGAGGLAGSPIVYNGFVASPVSSITAYEWREGSCSTGTLLSTASSFNLATPTVSAGRTIYLRVQDSNGTWSTNCPSRTVTVTAGSANGVCAATHYACTAGTSINNANGAASYTWICQGTLGGSSAFCSEPKSLPITTLSVSPSTPINAGQSATLNWTATNGATSCNFPAGSTLYKAAGYAYPADKSVSTGPLTTTSIYQMHCDNASGTGLLSNQVQVTVTVPNVTISADPSRVTKGGTTTITWNATGVTSCDITRNGQAWKSGLTGANLSSSSPDTITSQTTYVLTCTGGSGAATTATQIVNVVSSYNEF